MTEIVFLGTGTPNPDPKRQGPALAIVNRGQPVIVDCGPGVVRQAAAAGFSMGVLTRLLITHLHSDHTLGYPDMIFTPAVTGRESALEVWGPPGTAAMTDRIREAWAEDVSVRLRGGEPALPDAYEVRATEVIEGDVIDMGAFRATPFAVTHGAWRHALGYRIETDDRCIVVSGDTSYNVNLIRHARGCDVLIHEACSAAGLAKRTEEWRRYHSAYHTTGRELGRLAALVQPKLLLIHHLLPFGEAEEQVLDEVRESFSGPVKIAEDLGVY